MSITDEIKKNYTPRERETRRLELTHRNNSKPPEPQCQTDRLWSLIKPKVTAELAPVIKRVAQLEKTRVTVRDAETMMEAKLEKLEKRSRKSRDELYNKLREL